MAAVGVEKRASRKGARPRPSARGNGQAVDGREAEISERELTTLLRAMEAAAGGDFSVRMRPADSGVAHELGAAFNRLVESNARMASEISRVRRVVGRDGLITE